MLSKTMTILIGIIEQQPVNAYELNKWLTKMNIREGEHGHRDDTAPKQGRVRIPHKDTAPQQSEVHIPRRVTMPQTWYNIASSTVYATLKAAEKKGYITGSIEKSGNMPDKTVYSITESGKQEFLDTVICCISDFDYDITPFNIGMFFINALDRQKAAGLLEERVKLLQRYEHEIGRQIEKMEKEGVPQIYVLNTRQSLYIVQAQLKGASDIAAEMKEQDGSSD